MKTIYDVIIIGGSYAGLSAAMALGRSLRSVLVIDAGQPCNAQTPQSHNFLTQDGNTPENISAISKAQVLKYSTVNFFKGNATFAKKTATGFLINVSSGEAFQSKKIILATGLTDIFPIIAGFSECWGISVIHCPYCHGYEFQNQETGIISSGEVAFDLSKLISNWTNKLTVFSNGSHDLSREQVNKLEAKGIQIIETKISKINHTNGKVQSVIFVNGASKNVMAIYARPNLEQASKIPFQLGCEINENILIKVDMFQRTSVEGVYACGDNSSMRSLATAVSTGAMAGAMSNRDLINELF